MTAQTKTNQTIPTPPGEPSGAPYHPGKWRPDEDSKQREERAKEEGSASWTPGHYDQTDPMALYKGLVSTRALSSLSSDNGPTVLLRESISHTNTIYTSSSPSFTAPYRSVGLDNPYDIFGNALHENDPKEKP